MQTTPPRYVPTLTQVVPATQLQTVHPVTADAVVSPAVATPAAQQPSAEQIAHLLRQQLLVRTRQYIDIELQRRIRETVSQLALEYSHKLFEELQPQLEVTVSQVVEEAVAHAVAHTAAHAAGHGPAHES